MSQCGLRDFKPGPVVRGKGSVGVSTNPVHPEARLMEVVKNRR